MLSCIASACEGGDRKALYAASSGTLVLLRRIDEDAARFISTPPHPAHKHGHRKLTYVSALPKYGTSESLDKKQIIVKLTRRYSIGSCSPSTSTALFTETYASQTSFVMERR